MVLRGHIDKPLAKTLAFSKRTSLIALLVALSVSSNYALIWIPNVKLMDLLVFVAGFVAGPLDGAIVGALSWMVYGFLNPYGWILPIWIATMLSETIYGITGGIIRKNLFRVGKAELALIGLLCTLCYDILTNLAFSLTFNIPLKVALIAGIPFSLAHELSNAVLFSIAGSALIKLIEKFLQGTRDK